MAKFQPAVRIQVFLMLFDCAMQKFPENVGMYKTDLNL